MIFLRPGTNWNPTFFPSWRHSILVVNPGNDTENIKLPANSWPNSGQKFAPLDFGHRRLIYHETETTGFSYHETQKNQKPLNGQNTLHAVCGFTADADSFSQKSNSPANKPVFFLKLKTDTEYQRCEKKA